MSECSLSDDFGKFDDTRSGSQHQTNTLTFGSITPAPQLVGYTFKYKYIIGYCTQKHKGTGPILELKVGNTEVWKTQINLQTKDYPYDTRCGASSNKADNYSPWQEANFNIPANVGGSLVLTMIGTDRNIHVVGDGVRCTGKIYIFQDFPVSNILLNTLNTLYM